MKRKRTGMLLAALLINGIFILSQAQTIAWPEHPDKVYVFEINNRTAEKLLRDNIFGNQLPELLDRPVAVFSGKEENWENQLKQGHYILAEIRKNRINYSYMPVMPFQEGVSKVK